MRWHLTTTLLTALLLGAPARADTLYDRFGGKTGTDRLATLFTEKLTHDPRVASTFEETDLNRFRRMVSEQFCQVLDGGCTYTGHDMQQAHRGVHSTTAQFNAVVEDLQAAMDELGVPFSLQNRLLARLAPMHRDVVTR